MTGPEIMYAVGFIVTLFGFAFGIWKYLDAKLSLLGKDIAAVRLHVAENYVTKAGMSEQTQQIMKAIESIGTRIDNLGARIDGLYATPKPRRTTN